MPVGDKPATLPEADPAFLAALHAFPGELPRHIAVAVSGGSDSLAALHLMTSAAQLGGWQVRGVTVDHALRPESAAEAQGVAAICGRLGVPHHTLRWDHGVVGGNLPDAARQARYGLMAAWARGQGVSHIVLGHTADDQAETFLMGLGRAAGLDGLTGMRPCWDRDGVRFVRPFLSIRRGALRVLLQRVGQPWVDDPTNADDHYTRVRARRALAALAPLGITVDSLITVVANLSDAQRALDGAARRAADTLVQEAAGELIFDRPRWLVEAPAIQRRLLVAGLRAVSGAAHAPRAAALTRLMLAITEGREATLWGCRLRMRGMEFRLMREPRAVAGLTAAPGALWDGRWRVTGPFADGAEIRALGPAGLRACKQWRDTGASRDALLVSPAVWQGDRLISAPLAGHNPAFSARIEAGRSLFALSH